MKWNTCRWSCCYSNPLWGKIIRHCTVCVCRFMFGISICCCWCGWTVYIYNPSNSVVDHFCGAGHWLVLYTARHRRGTISLYDKSGTNPLLAWAPPPLAGRSSFLSSFMACQQLVKFILLYFLFVLTCPASVMLMCCVCLCSCFCQAGPSYLTPPLPVYIAITCWRTLNQSNKLLFSSSSCCVNSCVWFYMLKFQSFIGT